MLIDSSNRDAKFTNGTLQTQSSLNTAEAVSMPLQTSMETDSEVEEIRYYSILVLAWIMLVKRGSLGEEDDISTCTFELSFGESEHDPVKMEGQALEHICNRNITIEEIIHLVQSVLRGVFVSQDRDSIKWDKTKTTALRKVLTLSAGDQKKKLRIQLSDDLCPAQPHDISIENASSSAAAKACVATYLDLVSLLTQDPEQQISRAMTTTTGELEQLWEWNALVPPVIHRPIHGYIDEQIKAKVNGQAIASWDGSLSYNELDRLSTSLAFKLMDAGVCPGQAIPLCFEKSMWAVVALLGVIRTGAAFTLMDPTQPEKRLRTIVEDVAAKLVIVSKEQSKLGSQVTPNGKVVIVGPELLHESQRSRQPTLPTIQLEALLYIVFTSGSTGKPKGVMISNESYVSGAIPRAQAVGYSARSRVLDFPSYAFDVSIDCMLCTLANGGCVCIPSEDERVNDLSGVIRRLEVNMAHMTPSVARVLDADILPKLEVLGLGGESIAARDAEVWGRQTKLIIAYGPSECTVGCTINNMVEVGQRYISIGKGVGAVTWIVNPNDHSKLAPLNAIGELLIEGPVVGDGYLNEPEKTNEAFIRNPEWLVAGCRTVTGRTGRLYTTGDLVRYHPDGSGSIIFVGRADSQVKLRGQRVELGEIEYHVKIQLPAGIQVVAEVVKISDSNAEPMLVVFLADPEHENVVVNDERAAFSHSLSKVLSTIDHTLASTLPRYMIPAAYIPLIEIPKMVSSKTDRKKLRSIASAMSRKQLVQFREAQVVNTLSNVSSPTPSSLVSNVHSVSSTTSTMESLKIELWNALQKILFQLFGDETVIDSTYNFFDLGGDSLRAMKLVAMARSVGYSLTVSDIFKHANFNDLASAMTPIHGSQSLDIPPFSLLDSTCSPTQTREIAAKLCGIAPSMVEDVYPCTPLQEGLMALSAKVTEAYVAQRVVELDDVETMHRFCSAFEEVFDDSSILRTRIVQVPGQGLMQVEVKESITWHKAASLQEYIAQDRKQKMELGGSLIRFATIQEMGKLSFVLTIHHALYDGWSMPLIMDRVSRAYHGESQQRPVAFKSFIKYLNGQDSKHSEYFWREHLQGATGLQFPVLTSPGYQPQAEALLEHYVPLPKIEIRGISPMTIVRGAWALVASRYTAEKDVVFGETLAGRSVPVPYVEEIEGPLITTVPLRVPLSSEATVEGYLRQIQENTAIRIPHEHLGLQNIRRVSSDAKKVCELRTCLVMNPFVETEKSVKSIPGLAPASDTDAAREALQFNTYALMLVCSFDPDGFLVLASFDSKLIDAPQMQRLLSCFALKVQELCKDPGDTDLINNQPTVDETLELLRLSTSAAQDLAGSSDPFLRNAVAAWIVGPADTDDLLPPGAVGELLVERSPSSGSQGIKEPLWMKRGTGIIPQPGNEIYRTHMLARIKHTGKVCFIQRPGSTRDVDSAWVTLESKYSDASTECLTSEYLSLRSSWSRVLRMDESDIRPQDDFFALGGDSIAAMKLVSEARSDGFGLTVTQVFQGRILSAMVSILVRATTPQTIYKPFSSLDRVNAGSLVNHAKKHINLNSSTIVDIYPARPLQAIAVKGTTDQPRFSVRYEVLHFNSPIDKQRLYNSCKGLLRRNEILRTVFTEVNESIYGVVLEQLTPDILEYDVDSGDRKHFTQSLCDLDIMTSMPLGSSFVKFFLVHTTSQGSSLVIRLSHAQYDEMSLPLLLHQLSELYQDSLSIDLIPFTPYVQYVETDNIPKAKDYWTDLLKDSSLTVLVPRMQSQSTKLISISRKFNIAKRPKDTTIATLPTAAWALTLARRLSLKDVVFGEVVGGRNIGYIKAENVAGPCWQYVPVRVQFKSHWTATDLFKHIQEQHVESSKFEGMGLEEIRKYCTNWSSEINWFDSVVHQAVSGVNTLDFGSVKAETQTIYPHTEPLREWKVQAFVRGDCLEIEIVARESWLDLAESLLDDISVAMSQFIYAPHLPIFYSNI